MKSQQEFDARKNELRNNVRTIAKLFDNNLISEELLRLVVAHALYGELSSAMSLQWREFETSMIDKLRQKNIEGGNSLLPTGHRYERIR